MKKELVLRLQELRRGWFKMQHYFEKNPSSENIKNSFGYIFNDINFKFNSSTGVFSKGKVDFGSGLLIKGFFEDVKCEPRKILDVGCGVGVIGIVIAKVFKNSMIDMIDINTRALELAKENISSNEVENASAFFSDLFENVEGVYDKILSNPPIRVGKELVFRVYEDAYKYLKSGGALYIVIQKKQGAPSSQEKLEEIFGNCEIIIKSKGYRVLKAVK